MHPRGKAVTFAAFGTLTWGVTALSCRKTVNQHTTIWFSEQGVTRQNPLTPIVTGKCPFSPPSHEHFSNSLPPLYATYGQTFSHPPSHLLQFFCCLEVAPGIFKIWNKCMEKEKLLRKLLSVWLSLIHIKVDKQAGYYQKGWETWLTGKAISDVIKRQGDKLRKLKITALLVNQSGCTGERLHKALGRSRPCSARAHTGEVGLIREHKFSCIFEIPPGESGQLPDERSPGTGWESSISTRNQKTSGKKKKKKRCKPCKMEAGKKLSASLDAGSFW